MSQYTERIYKRAIDWTFQNPVLANNVIGIESDTEKFKKFDGVKTWNELAYETQGLTISEVQDIADDAESNAVATASADATSKANTAESNAKAASVARTNGTINRVLQILDINGVVSNEIGDGGQAGLNNTTVGLDSLKNNTTGYSNTATGESALRYNTTGYSNTANGVSALRSNTTGANNTANGVGALQNNTTGANNTANGLSALLNNTTGNFNTANGLSALRSNTTGYSNTANGLSALRYNTTGNFNTANGASALANNTTGYSNTANGASALLNNTTGNSNTANGVDALRSNTTGYSNTANGVGAGTYDVNGNSMTNFNNVTCLGYNSRAGGSNQVVLGDVYTTPYAQNALVVRSDERDKTELRATSLGLDFIKALTPREYKWDYRDFYFDKVDVVVGQDEDGNDIIEEQLVPVEKDGSRKRVRYHQGFIAQEVKNVMDDLEIDFGGYKDAAVDGGCDVLSLGYEEFIAPMVKAMQEQQAIIEDLQARLAVLEGV